MYKEPTTIQAIGMCIAMTGLIINNGFFIYCHSKMLRQLKEANIKVNLWLPTSFFFRFRELAKTNYDLKKRQQQQKLLSLLYWSFSLSIVLMFAGSLICCM